MIKHKNSIFLFIYCLFFFAACSSDNLDLFESETLTYKEIWSENSHCAFTSLVEYKGKYYCAFRESNAHISDSPNEYGGIRILVSEDGNSWVPFELLTDSNFDLRDPKLSVNYENKLVLLHGCTNKNISIYPKTKIKFFTDNELNGRYFEDSNYFPISIENDEILSNYWLWRITWHNNKAYGVAYKHGKKPLLVSSEDGINYEVVTALDALGNEADIYFESDNRMMIAMRAQEGNGFIGQSIYPYSDWTWHETRSLFHCPNIFEVDNDLFMAGRGVGGTTLFHLEGNDISPVIVLPSEGDNAYPGAIIVNDEVWVSYYSGSSGTSIYFAKLKINDLLNRVK